MGGGGPTGDKIVSRSELGGQIRCKDAALRCCVTEANRASTKIKPTGIYYRFGEKIFYFYSEKRKLVVFKSIEKRQRCLRR